MQFWAYFLLLLGSAALAIHSSPVYFYPQKGMFDPYNSEGVVVRSDLFPSLFNAIYDDSVRLTRFLKIFINCLGIQFQIHA